MPLGAGNPALHHDALFCRECRHAVPADAPTCPECGAPHPARPAFAGEGYEFVSPHTWMGSPLVHIAFGMDSKGKPRVAKGIVAIGQSAKGVVAIGINAFGFISIGVSSIGLVALGVNSVALLAAGGVVAVAPVAFGVVAVGYLVGGVSAVGWKVLFSVR